MLTCWHVYSYHGIRCGSTNSNGSSHLISSYKVNTKNCLIFPCTLPRHFYTLKWKTILALRENSKEKLEDSPSWERELQDGPGEDPLGPPSGAHGVQDANAYQDWVLLWRATVRRAMLWGSQWKEALGARSGWISIGATLAWGKKWKNIRSCLLLATPIYRLPSSPKSKPQTLCMKGGWLCLNVFTLAFHSYVFNWPLNVNSFSNIQI